MNMGHANMQKTCSRSGCSNNVKKPTAKYCSVQCCAKDPARLARLSLQARRNARRTVLPMAHQLSLGLTSRSNPEWEIARLGETREDIPMGMARLAG